MRAALALALAVLGCSCDDGPAVPFGLEGQRGEVVPAEPEPAVPEPRTETQEWAEGAAVAIGGLPLAVDAGTIRATVASDLDGDGDTDAVLIALSPEGPAFFAAVSSGAAFGAPARIPLSLPPPDPACTWTRLSFIAGASEAAIAALVRQCTEEEATVLVALRLDAAPRVLETFTLAAASGQRVGASLVDRDGDGHEDLALSLEVTTGDGPGNAELVYFDRPAGLSRDTAQPEASLAAALGFDRPIARRHPDRLAAAARRTIALHAAVCAPTSRLTIGSSRGALCSASSSLGRAFVVLAAASAHAGDTLAAIDAVAALDRPSVTVRDPDRAIANDAVRAMSGTLTPPTHDGPEAHPLSTTPEQRLSTLGFVDEDHLLIRGRAQALTLSTGEVLPEPAAEDTRLGDRAGRFMVVEMVPTCGAPELVVEAVGGLADAVLSPRRRIATGPAAPCAGASGSRALELDGLRVLGWAPQGILLAHGVMLTLVPLDLEARPAGEPSVLAADAPPPAPIAAGFATADASAWALSSPLGIVVLRRAEADARLVRPSGFVGTEGTAQDVALSPSSERIAWISGGRVHWAALAEIAPPAAPSPP